MILPRHKERSSNEYQRSNGSFPISPYSSKFQPRHHPAVRKRRQFLLKVGSIIFGGFVILSLISQSFRVMFLPMVGLGFLVVNDIVDTSLINYYDLRNYQGTDRGWERGERILMLTPLRDASSHMPMFFSHLRNFTYPHHLIDLAFLVSDSKDDTLALLTKMLKEVQADPSPNMWFGDITVIEKDFGQAVGQDFSDRHGFKAQGPRRKLMARARNWLLNATLKPKHSWVYWRDADVETAPATILEDLMRHNKDVIVPNVWRPLPDWLGGEQPYDLNSWQESETGLKLAAELDEDAVIVEGYAEYATWRPHLAYLRDPYGDPDLEMPIDGVGGVSILAKARVFRYGIHFPAFSFEKHAETEGFGKMARRAKFSVVGLPHYTIWHLYEPSTDDLKHMKEMDEQKQAKEKAEKEKLERKKKMEESGWQVKKETWDQDQRDIVHAALRDENKKLEVQRSKEKSPSQDSAHKHGDHDHSVKMDSKGKILKGGDAGPMQHTDDPDPSVEGDVKHVKGDGKQDRGTNNKHLPVEKHIM